MPAPRSLPAWLLAGLVALAPAACTESPPPDVPPRSLLLIVIDTLRSDHLGCYGYAFPTSPTLDSLATAGTRFQRAVSAVPVTLPSISTILTGRYPIHHGVRDNGLFKLPSEEETLAERFRAAGFRTAAVIASDTIAPDRGLDQGFEIYDATFGGDYPVWTESLKPFAESMGATRRRADRVTDRATEVLKGFGTAPFFLFVHYFDVHHQYDPPPEFAAGQPGRPYDGEIAFADHEIGRLLGALPDPASTLVVVVGDHGEALGEHGEPEHGFLLHGATLRVPMIACGPGVPAALVREDPVSLVDLEPTLAGAFSLPADGPPTDGRRLRWGVAESAPVPLFEETFRTLVSYGWSELRAVRVGDWKLVRGTQDELYDLSRDPGEVAPVPLQGDTYRRLDRLLTDFARGDDPEAVYAAAHGAPDPQSEEKLASLGYASGGPPTVFPKDRPDPREELPRWFDRQVAKVFARNAMMLLKQSRNETALALLDSCLVLDSENVSGHALRGDARLRLGDTKGALEDYHRAVELDPDMAPVHRVLARIAESQGQADEAMARWKEFLRVEPNDPEGHFRLGALEDAAGRPDEAREQLETVLRLAPDHPEAARIREWLARH